MALKIKKNSKNIDTFVTLIEKDSKDLCEKFLNQANILRLKKLHKDALKLYLNVILMDRKNYEAYLGLALAYKSIGEFEKAILNLKKAKILKPFIPEVYFQLGVCYNIVAKPDIAVNYLKKAIKLDNKKNDYKIQLAISHELMNEEYFAIQIYQKIIDDDPSYILAYNYKATLYLNIGDYKNASKEFYKILKINAQYYNAYLGIGICFDRLNKISKAIRYYKKFLNLKPKSHNIVNVKSRLSILKICKNKSNNISNNSFANHIEV